MTSLQVKGLPHQCSITSLQETPGSSRNPRLPCLLWVLQKPLSSLGISEPLRHLQSSSSTPVSLQALHCCSSCPSCHLSQLQGCGHSAWGRQHSRRSVSVPFFPLLVLLLREWFQAPDGKTCHTLQAALEILHLWFSCCSAGHCRVPRARPQWGNHRWQSLFLSPHTEEMVSVLCFCLPKDYWLSAFSQNGSGPLFHSSFTTLPHF